MFSVLGQSIPGESDREDRQTQSYSTFELWRRIVAAFCKSRDLGVPLIAFKRGGIVPVFWLRCCRPIHCCGGSACQKKI